MGRSRGIDSKEENCGIKRSKSDAALSFSKLLKAYSYGVIYSPIRAEVSPEELVSIALEVDLYIIAPNANLDPFDEATNAVRLAKGREGFLFIPGWQFDAFGTRHGQGGGWYDRFLTHIPASWLRIGFCLNEHFSQIRLVRKSWDQPMDYVCVVDRTNELVALHKTNARTHDVSTIT